MIEIRNCSKAFGEIHAIDHVLMEIGERQIFGLVGTNGAGKDKTADILHFRRWIFSTGIYGSRSERFLQRILSGLYD